MLEIIRIIFSLLLTLFLPGYAMANVIFERGELHKEYDVVYRGTLGMVFSLIILVFVGFSLNALGANPDTGLGYVNSTNIILSLLAITVILFMLGWWRGSYPFMGRLHPALKRPRYKPTIRTHKTSAGETKYLIELDELYDERERLTKEMERVSRKIRFEGPKNRKYYADRRTALQRKFFELNKRIAEIEEEKK